MLEYTTRLILAAGNFRTRTENLCKKKTAEGYRLWRPDALGYVLVQIRERLGAVEYLNVYAVLELVQLLEVAVAWEVQSAHRDSRRVREIVRLVSESYTKGSDLYRRMAQEDSFEPDVHELLERSASRIVAIVRRLQKLENRGA